MSKANLIQLYETIGENPELEQRIQGQPEEAIVTDIFLKMGEEQNLPFIKEEFEEWVATDRNGRFPVRVEAHGDSRPLLNLNEQGEEMELTDEQLEAVAGGSCAGLRPPFCVEPPSDRGTHDWD